MESLHNIKNLEFNRKDLRKQMTKSEILLWSRLRGKNIGFKFRRQHSIGSFIVDFYCAECNVIIELDGITHDDPKNYQQDLIKEDFLKEKGLYLLRFNDTEIYEDLDGVLEGICTVCNQRVSK